MASNQHPADTIPNKQLQVVFHTEIRNEAARSVSRCANGDPWQSLSLLVNERPFRLRSGRFN